VGQDHSGAGAAAWGAFLGFREACVERSLDAARMSACATMKRIVIASVAIGVVDAGGIHLFQHFSLLRTASSLESWALTGLALWASVFGFGLYRWGARSLWSLVGLPLVLFPLAVIIAGAGMI
jgi:hypothetical protein